MNGLKTINIIFDETFKNKVIMATKIKGTEVPPIEWAKHFRPKGKKLFWHQVRTKFRSKIKKDALVEI